MAALVNGPEGDALDWGSINWPRLEGEVRHLRQRIFTASQAEDLKKVRNLQKLMLRSRANALMSVRRVTELNAGRKTAGVDGKVVVSAPGKAALADRVRQHGHTISAQPVKRVYIPKANGKQRPLGIPVIVDRVRQAQVVNALEPEWEARFEPRSYGFRPGRGCHDAIEAIYKVGRGPNPSARWVLDADLAAAFDRIDHHLLLAQLGTFPARDLVEQWLKAGVIEQGRLTPTEEGTPQGGVVSPVLLNVALHGMERAAGVRYQLIGTHAGKTVTGSPVLIRYADDLVALCTTKAQAERVKASLAEWLSPRGLAFNEDKTRIVTLDEGFDFLGFTVRRFGAKLLIRPSKAALRRSPCAAPRRDALSARSQRGDGAATAHPHRAGVGGLLSDGGVQRDVLCAGPLCVEAHLQVGQAQSPEEVEALDRQPVLRQVQQVQARLLGVRRPPQRRLPREARLDEDRPTPAGQGGGFSG